MVSFPELKSYGIVVAGTFGPLHDGHRELLDEAVSRGDTIIGVTSDRLARTTRDVDRYVPSYTQRRRAVRDELVHFSRKHENQYTIVKIDDPYGLASELPNLESIVITPKDGARKRAEELNEHRRKNGLNALDVIESDIVFAEDGNPISSTRIIDMEIDEHGELI
jgi:pantetheine-phosphate adenylyltransferase